MERIKKRWEISKNWQLLFPILGMLMTIATAYLITRRFLHGFELNNMLWEWPFTLFFTIAGSYLILKICFWCFKKLENKWKVDYKWEMIAIFIVFAITGSVSAKFAEPLTHWAGIYRETSNPWLYWSVRIFIILPVYQVILVAIGWLFGQFKFFWGFEKKMLTRMGLGILFK
ncbi:MAG: DUF6787 family protein [Bacteroidota bacterium]